MAVNLRFAQSARRHRIGRGRVRDVIEQAVFFDRVPAPAGSPLPDERLVFLGDDRTGRALEVVAVELADGALLVIHAMDLRDKYRDLYEEAKNARNS